jgi:fumarylacetoacetase
MALKSWVESANDPESDFPIQNLPFGAFRHEGDAPAIGVAIGDQIFDLRRSAEAGLLPPDTAAACRAESLNALMALGPRHWSRLRDRLTALLSIDPHGGVAALKRLIVPMSEAVMLLPAQIGDYTDFYASIDHATNVGRLFRPGNPLLPNYKYVPIGYHGRASSIMVSGTPVVRPVGQVKAANVDVPEFVASRSLDYELEVGFFIGQGNALGEAIPVSEAESHIFGLCLVNDWSARDIQAWEYQPLGPFLGKSFITSISPWVVTLHALAPFRTAVRERPEGDPDPLPYLALGSRAGQSSIDLTVEAYLVSRKMRESGIAPVRLSRGNFGNLYWTMAQMLTHHASNGCNLRPGDLMASGTVSGPSPNERGCLLELTQRGAEPVELPDGERRSFLEDGDEVILRGFCEREDAVRVGFGECRGVITAARERK